MSGRTPRQSPSFAVLVPQPRFDYKTGVASRNFLARLSSNSWMRLAIPGALIILCVVLAYLPAVHNGFIWDDDVYITNDSLLTAPDGLWRIWFSLDVPSQYFPLTYTVFRIEHALWGFNPAGYHWVNLLLHATNALLVWRLLARLRVPGAWLGAALFAPASGAGGIGGLGHGTQKHLVRCSSSCCRCWPGLNLSRNGRSRPGGIMGWRCSFMRWRCAPKPPPARCRRRCS